jgi:translocation and assembly module TamA
MSVVRAAAMVLAMMAGAAAAQTHHYTVRIEGAPSEDVRERLRSVSEAVSLREEAPASLLHLQRRAQRDRDTFLRVMRARAWYAAGVDVDIDYEAAPPAVVFRIEPGPRYTLGAVAFSGPDDTTLARTPDPGEIGLKPGAPARAEPVIDAQSQLVAWYREAGYPFPRVVERRPVVYHASRSLDVTYVVDLGPEARFGPLDIQGLTSVRERAVRERVAWAPGDAYAPALVNRTRQHLYQSGLFTAVEVTLSEDVGPDGRAPVTIRVEERKHRTAGLGARYHTGEGPGVVARWEHRNVGGLGRRLRIEANIAAEEQRLAMNYLLPRFQYDARIRLSFEAGHEESEAYEADYMESRAVSEWTDDRWTYEAGPVLRVSRAEQQGREDTYTLAGLMLRAMWDGSNDAMNPTRGARLRLELGPYVDLREGAFITQASAEVRGYLPLDNEARWVVAARLRLGLTLASGLNAVPPDLRFYAGGGGSVRGYEYQTVTPLRDGDPIGGRSVLDGSLELRRRLSESLGAVLFVDAGSAYEAAAPDFEEPLRWSAGAGLRYFSPLGPFRFDLAFPLNARDRDDTFQFYVSLGQAF